MKKCVVFFILLIAVLILAVLTENNSGELRESQDLGRKMTAFAE